MRTITSPNKITTASSATESARLMISIAQIKSRKSWSLRIKLNTGKNTTSHVTLNWPWQVYRIRMDPELREIQFKFLHWKRASISNVTHNVLSIYVGPALHKHTHTLSVAFLSGKKQRRVSSLNSNSKAWHTRHGWYGMRIWNRFKATINA